MKLQKEETNKKQINKNAIGYVLICITAIILALICFTSTSPLYPDNYAGDSAINLVYGKSFVNGILPYRDLYATNGPFFYLIQALAWIGGHGRAVMWLLEVIALVVSTGCTYHLLRKKYEVICSIIATILFQLIAISVIGEGNTVEEFCIPFLMIGMVILFSEREKKVTQTILLAIGTSIVLMISISYAIIFIGIWIAWFLSERASTNRGHHWIGGIVGLIIPMVITYVIYAIAGVTNGYKEQYIIYSFKKMVLSFANSSVWLHKGVKLLPVIVVLLIIVVMLVKKSQLSYVKKMGALVLAMLVCGLLGNEEWHRFLFNAIAFVVGVMLISNIDKKQIRMGMAFALLVITGGVQLTAGLSCARIVYADLNGQYKEYNEEIEEVSAVFGDMKNQPDLYLMYDTSGRFYFMADMLPTYKYFTNTSEVIQIYPEVEQEIVDYVEQQKIQMICGNIASIVKNESLANIVDADFEYFTDFMVEPSEVWYLLLSGVNNEEAE